MRLKFIVFVVLLISALAFQVSPYARRIRPFSSTPSSCQENEIGYNMTSHALVICTNAGYQILSTGASGSFAPSNATFITQTPNTTLTNEQALSALATGIVKNTTTTGVLSIAAAGTDYESPLVFTASDFDRAVNIVSIDYTNGQAASGAAKGFLIAADWTVFNNKEEALTFNSPLSRIANVISCSTCALTSGNLSQFAATTSAQLAGVLNDESGSGVALFATLTSLTANDVLTWNGSNWINQAVSGGGGAIGTGNINMTIANASSTGTTANRLAKLTGAPSTAIITATTDTENAIGVCTGNCGTTGNATIAIAGQVDCEFDGATTAGNYVIISSITAGMCHDGGSSFPTSGAAYGKVLTTNVGAGTYSMTLMTPDIAFQNAGNGKSKPGTPSNSFQYNGTGNTFAGGNLFEEDANTVAIRNSTTAQTFNFYQSFTDASNYSRLRFGSGSGVFSITSEALGTGTQQALTISLGTKDFEFSTTDIKQGSGDGLSLGTITRPWNALFASDVTLADAGTLSFGTTGSRIKGNISSSGAIGFFDFNNNGTGWTGGESGTGTFGGITQVFNSSGTKPWQRVTSVGLSTVTGWTNLHAGGVTGFWANVDSPTGDDVLLMHENSGGSSAAADRFHNNTGMDILLSPDDLAFFVYDETSSRWRAGEFEDSNTALVATQFDKTSSTTLADVTMDHAFNVSASRTYSFVFEGYTTSDVAGGVKFAIGGSATATSIIYEAIVIDANVNAAQTRATALGTAVGGVTTVTAAKVRITGTIVVNAAGTLTVQFAQNASNGSASSILVGSVFTITKVR